MAHIEDALYASMHLHMVSAKNMFAKLTLLLSVVRWEGAAVIHVRPTDALFDDHGDLMDATFTAPGEIFAGTEQPDAQTTNVAPFTTDTPMTNDVPSRTDGLLTRDVTSTIKEPSNNASLAATDAVTTMVHPSSQAMYP